MPNFKKNKSAFMMKGYSYPGASPMQQDKGDKALNERNTAILNNDNAQEELHYALEENQISKKEFDVKLAELKKKAKILKQ